MNFDKFNKDATYRIFRHCYRTKNKKGEYNERKNKDIDFSKTYLNYTINGLSLEQVEAKLEDYKSKFKVRNKTTVLVGSWVIQLPDFYEGDSDLFFRTCYKIFKSKYPYDLEGFVHHDESRGHMHFLFSPILDGQFNCKKLVNQTELEEMHLWMEGELEKEFGYHIDLIKPETRARKEMLKELGKDAELFNCGEKPQYLPMRELKKRTQMKIIKDYMEEEEKVTAARNKSIKQIKEYQDIVEEYKKKNNIDEIIKENKEMVPKQEVQQMIGEIFDMLEMDLPKDRVKKYRKVFDKFGYVLDKVKDTIKEI